MGKSANGTELGDWSASATNSLSSVCVCVCAHMSHESTHNNGCTTLQNKTDTHCLSRAVTLLYDGGVSKNFRTDSITNHTLTTINTR